MSAAPQQTPAGTVQPDPSDRLKNGSRATAAGQTNAEKNGRTPTNSGSEEDDDRSEDRQLANDVDKVNLSSAERPRPRLRRPRTLETTMFDRLEKMYGPGIKRMLTVQYRCEASSEWVIYSGD
jgi:DNA polymerase alpha-associated DNA helicase A